MDKNKIAVPLVCHGHSRPVVDLFYSPITPDGFFLISASKDSTPMLRNGETGDWIGTFEGHKGAVWGCCLDANALRAATASADFTAKLWDALTGDVLQSFEHKHIVRACAFSEDTHLLLTGGVEKILRIYDLNRPDAPPREVDNSPGSVRTVSWLHSDRTILSSCTDFGGVSYGDHQTPIGTGSGSENPLVGSRFRSLELDPYLTLTLLLLLWDVRSDRIVRTLETKSPVTCTEVSQDGRYITTANGSTVKFWDANLFGLVKSYDMPCNVESASLEPKFGNKFIVGGEDMWVHIFDFHTGAEIGCNKGHHGPVHCMRFAPGGESYASGSEDGTIRIWQTGPLSHNIDNNENEKEKTVANGRGKEDGSVEEVARKIGGFDIAKEDKENAEPADA
ncbi:hypothetical protein LguiA_028599 [Lonicera macranthoides]